MTMVRGLINEKIYFNPDLLKQTDELLFFTAKSN